MMCEAGDAMVDTLRHEFAPRRPVTIACQFDVWSDDHYLRPSVYTLTFRRRMAA
jgi:hypothetical protein